MQHDFYPMGRHLCKVVETFTLKTNGQFSITLSFFYGPARKLYEPSALNLVFRLLKSVYQGKKTNKPNHRVYPTCPELGVSIQLHKPCFWPVTQCCVSSYLQAAPKHTALLLGGGSAGDIRTFRQKEPKFHGFLFPTNQLIALPLSQSSYKFLVEYFPLALLDNLLSPLFSLKVTIEPLKRFMKSNFSAKPVLICIKDVACQC